MFSPLELVDSVIDSGFLFIYGLLRPTFVQMEQYHVWHYGLANIIDIQKIMSKISSDP